MVSIYKFGSDDCKKIIERIMKRTDERMSEEIEREVAKILDDVKERGDEAIIDMTAKYDNVSITIDQIKISEEAILSAFYNVSKDFIYAIREAKENIERFHKNQRRTSWVSTNNGVIFGQKVTPIERVGIYVPTGRAVYPSQVIMNAVPARIAGVNEIIVVTPPNKDTTVDPHVLVSAKEVGVTSIFMVGGAQAIAALAFGTKTIPKVDKIVGVGNNFVMSAKKMVYGLVDIDMFSGPSEIAIICDESANPTYISADILAQVEHNANSYGIIITTSEKLANEVRKEIILQVEKLSRKEIIKESLSKFGAIIIVDDMDSAVKSVNDLAPQHLEILTRNPWELLDSIKNAGIISLGEYTPEALSDYLAGPNDVIPTGGTARFQSSLGVDAFLKTTSFISYTKRKLYEDGAKVIELANTEGLSAHAESIKKRFEAVKIESLPSLDE